MKTLIITLVLLDDSLVQLMTRADSLAQAAPTVRACGAFASAQARSRVKFATIIHDGLLMSLSVKDMEHIFGISQQIAASGIVDHEVIGQSVVATLNLGTASQFPKPPLGHSAEDWNKRLIRGQ